MSFIAVLLVLLLSNTVCAQQNNESTPPPTKLHSPKKATYLALIPGMGQVYNKKYWKLPIVYAGFGVTGYFAFWNRSEYLKFNEAYICVDVNGENCTNPTAIKYEYNKDNLKTLRDYYRRDMEFSFILMGVWYIIQIIDASVDAHLYYWEVDDNLSVKLDPVIQESLMPLPQNIAKSPVSHNGLKLTFSF